MNILIGHNYYINDRYLTAVVCLANFVVDYSTSATVSVVASSVATTTASYAATLGEI